MDRLRIKLTVAKKMLLQEGYKELAMAWKVKEVTCRRVLV